MAYYLIEPWGPDREDARALWAGAMAVAPYRKEGSDPPRFKDYFPHLARVKSKENGPVITTEMLEAFAMSSGG